MVEDLRPIFALVLTQISLSLQLHIKFYICLLLFSQFTCYYFYYKTQIIDYEELYLV